METNETLIINSLREGSDVAYKYIYDHHYQALCCVAARYLHDDFLAETVVGDVIFHLWEVRQTVNISTSLRSYLLRSVRNKCLDYLKSEYNRRINTLSSLPPDTSSALDTIASGGETADRVVEQELDNEVDKAIKSLPDECRHVFMMSRFEGKTYAEIAADTGISINTVKYHIKHALALLSEKLSPYLYLTLLLLL